MVNRGFENGRFCEKSQTRIFDFDVTASVSASLKVLRNEMVCFDLKNKCTKNEVCTSNHFGTVSTQRRGLF